MVFPIVLSMLHTLLQSEEDAMFIIKLISYKTKVTFQKTPRNRREPEVGLTNYGSSERSNIPANKCNYNSRKQPLELLL